MGKKVKLIVTYLKISKKVDCVVYESKVKVLGLVNNQYDIGDKWP